MQTIEKLLNDFVAGNASERFIPNTLLFERDGGYALLLDDKKRGRYCGVSYAPSRDFVAG